MTKLTSFIAPEGAKVFNAKPEKDVVGPLRQKVAARIDDALKQIKAGEEKPKRGLYEIRGDVAKATVRKGSRVMTLEGQDHFFVPKDKLAAFYEEVKKQVLAGDHDEAIQNAGQAAAGGKKARSGNYGWSEERKRKFQETMAAKRAEKEKAGK